MSKLIIDPEVRKAFDRLRGEDDNTSWILCGYKAGSNNALEVIGCGPGGMPELIARLPKKIAWGAFKVVGVDDRVGSCVSYRPRFVFIRYIPYKDEGGKSISPIQRARMGGHKGQIKQIVQSTVDIEIDSPADLTEELVIAKLETAGGAFPPTRYEFSAFQATGRLVISEPQQNDGNIGASSRARTPTSSSSSLSLAFPAAPATAAAFSVTGGETSRSGGISAAIAALMDQHLTASSTEETSSIKPVALSHGLGQGLELGLEPGLGPELAPTSVSSMVSALSRRSSMKIDVSPPSATPRGTISGLNSMGSPSLSALSSMSAEDDDSNPSTTTTTTTSTAAADSATATATGTSTSANVSNAKPSMAGRRGADWKGSLLSHSISISRSISESDDPLQSPGLRSAFMRRSSVAAAAAAIEASSGSSKSSSLTGKIMKKGSLYTPKSSNILVGMPRCSAFSPLQQEGPPHKLTVLPSEAVVSATDGTATTDAETVTLTNTGEEISSAFAALDIHTEEEKPILSERAPQSSTKTSIAEVLHSSNVYPSTSLPTSSDEDGIPSAIDIQLGSVSASGCVSGDTSASKGKDCAPATAEAVMSLPREEYALTASAAEPSVEKEKEIESAEKNNEESMKRSPIVAAVDVDAVSTVTPPLTPFSPHTSPAITPSVTPSNASILRAIALQKADTLGTLDAQSVTHSDWDSSESGSDAGSDSDSGVETDSDGGEQGNIRPVYRYVADESMYTMQRAGRKATIANFDYYDLDCL